MRLIKCITCCLCLLMPTILEAANSITMSPQQISSLGISVARVESAVNNLVLHAPASVTIPPAHEYVVSATQGGILEQMPMSIGDNVKKGQVVARLNSPELLTLQLQFLKATTDLALITRTYQREKRLFSQGIIAGRRVHEAANQYQSALADVNAAQQLLEISGMTKEAITQLATSQRFNSQLAVYAPVNGVVMERMAVPGARVDTLAPLYRIADLNELWLDISVPQERIADIHLGDKAVIENSQVTAIIKVFGKSVDLENQTVLVRALVQGKPAIVRVGKHVNVQILCEDIEDAFKVPDSALAQSDGKTFVFVKTAAGFEATEVHAIGKEGNASIVKGKLRTDAQIATKGAVALKANWLGLGSEE